MVAWALIFLRWLCSFRATRLKDCCNSRSAPQLYLWGDIRQHLLARFGIGSLRLILSGVVLASAIVAIWRQLVLPFLLMPHFWGGVHLCLGAGSKPLDWSE